jgi:hypothetical protein
VSHPNALLLATWLNIFRLVDGLSECALAGEWILPPVPPKKIKPGSREEMHLKIGTKNLAVIAIYAALYAALVIVVSDLHSYGPLQIRLADSLLAAVPLLGIAGVLGHTLEYSSQTFFPQLGLIDLLNTIPSFAMAFVVYYVYKRTQQRLHCNWNLHRLLSRLRYNCRMDACLTC